MKFISAWLRGFHNKMENEEDEKWMANWLGASVVDYL